MVTEKEIKIKTNDKEKVNEMADAARPFLNYIKKQHWYDDFKNGKTVEIRLANNEYMFMFTAQARKKQ